MKPLCVAGRALCDWQKLIFKEYSVNIEPLRISDSMYDFFQLCDATGTSTAVM